MRKLVNFSVYHPLSVLMILLGVILVAFVCMFFIPINSMPFIAQERLIVFTQFEGTGVKEIEKFITIPLEESLASLKGLKNIQSISRNGISLITLELHWNRDSDLALLHCTEIIDETYQVLPKDCSKPKIFKEEYSNFPSVTVALIPKNEDDEKVISFLGDFAEKHLKYEMQRLESVGLVSVFGNESKEIEVLVDKEKADRYGFSLKNIAESIEQNNFQYPAGFIREGDRELLVKTVARLKNEEELKKIPVFVDDSLVFLDAFCKIQNSAKEKESFFIYNGKNCISLQIFTKKGKSPLVISNQVKKLLKKINNQYNGLFTCEIIYDEGSELRDSLSSVLLSALIGALVTFAVIFLFYSSLFVASVLASIIPLCLIFSSFVLFLCGKTFNLMSLSGIAIGIGMVVDASSVIIDELISKKREGSLKKQDIVAIVNSLYMSNVGSTLTTVIAFSPIFFIKGILASIFFDLVIAIVASLIFALILSFSFVPAIFSLVKKNAFARGFIDKKCSLLIDRYTGYLKLQKLSLLKITFLLAVLCMIGFIACICIKKEFFPKMTTKELCFNQYYPENREIGFIEEDAKKFISVLESIYWKNRQVFTVETIEGGGAIFNPLLLRNPEVQEKMISWKLLINPTIKNSIARTLLENFFEKTTLEETIVDNSSYLEHIFDGMLRGFAVSHDSFEQAKKLSEELKTENGIVFPREKELVQIFIPNSAKLAYHSVTSSEIAFALHYATEGVNAEYLYKNEEKIPIVVKYSEENPTIDFIKRTLVFNSQGKGIYLDSLGIFEPNFEYTALFRYNRKPAFLLSEIKSYNKNVLDFTKTYFDEILTDGLIIIIGIFFVLYFILAAQFESFYLPFLILLSCIPAFGGAFFFLFITNASLNCNSLLALVILFGTVVNNAILLYESCNASKEKNFLGLLTACAKKLRTILVTSLTTILALIPFTFNFTGKNMQSSLALALIGGLVFSTIFILLIFPHLFVNFFQKKSAYDV